MAEQSGNQRNRDLKNSEEKGDTISKTVTDYLTACASWLCCQWGVIIFHNKMASSFTLDVCVCTVCSSSLIGLCSWHVCTQAILNMVDWFYQHCEFWLVVQMEPELSLHNHESARNCLRREQSKGKRRWQIRLWTPRGWLKEHLAQVFSTIRNGNIDQKKLSMA